MARQLKLNLFIYPAGHHEADSPILEGASA